MSDTPCPDDFMLTPVVQSRNCGTPANLVSGCPDTEYPVVVSAAAVPAHGNTITLSVHPTAAFTPGMWVTIATGQGQVPFTGKIEGVTATEIVVRNAMANGAAILRNPPANTPLVQCGAVAISAEPNNVSEDPQARCTPDMAVPVTNEIVGMMGLTRGETVGESGKCHRFVHKVGASPDTLWVKAMPGVTPAQEQEFRYVIWDATAEGGLLKRVSKTSSTLAFMRIGAGGNASYTDTLDGATVTDAPGLGLPAGTSMVFFDSAAKAFYRIASVDGKMIVGESGTWKLKDAITNSWTVVPGEYKAFSQVSGTLPSDVTSVVDLKLTPGYLATFRQALVTIYMSGVVTSADYRTKVKIDGKLHCEIRIVAAFGSQSSMNQVILPISVTGTVTVEIEHTTTVAGTSNGSEIYVRVDGFM